MVAKFEFLCNLLFYLSFIKFDSRIKHHISRNTIMNLKGFKTLSIHIDLEENQFVICILVCSSRASKTNIKPYMRIFTSDQNSEA